MSDKEPRIYGELDFLYGTRRDDQGDKTFLMEAADALNKSVTHIDGVNEFRIRRQHPGEGSVVILEPVGGEVGRIRFDARDSGSLNIKNYFAGAEATEETPRIPRSISCTYQGDLGSFIYHIDLEPV